MKNDNSPIAEAERELREMQENERVLRRRGEWPVDDRAPSYSIRDAAALLNVSPRTIRNRIKSGELAAYRYTSNPRTRRYIERQDLGLDRID